MRYKIILLMTTGALLAGFANCSRDMSANVDANNLLAPSDQISISYNHLQQSSVPIQVGQMELPTMENQARLIWYNPYGQYPIKYIWPNKTFPSSTVQTQNILILNFAPDSSASTPQRSWAGIMQHLDVQDTLFTVRKHLDIMLQSDPITTGILHIDFGVISEDVIPNGLLDSEDKLRQGLRNGLLDSDEDVGLDGMANNDPRAQAAGGDFWDLNDNGVKDAGEPFSDDDYAYNPQKSGANGIDYSHINGTENSKKSARGIKPDSEDLNGNGVLDLENNYFSFALHLSHSHEDYASG